MKQLKDISNKAIAKVRANMTIGTSNQSRDIIRTSGWSSFADGCNLDLLSETLKVDALYSSGPLGDGSFAAKESSIGLIAKAGNCGYMSSLALKFIAEDPMLTGKITAKRKYFCDPIHHAFIEISDGINVVYCDPWLNQTFTSVKEIANGYLEIERAHIARLESVIKELNFINFTVDEIDNPGSLDQEILEELEKNFVAYCYKNQEWALSQATMAIEEHKSEVQTINDFMAHTIEETQYLQDDNNADSYKFTLSEKNKIDFLTVCEFFYLLELKTLYPGQPELHRTIQDAFSKTKRLHGDITNKDEILNNFAKWMEQNVPNKPADMALIFNKINNRQATNTSKGNREHKGVSQHLVSMKAKL